MKFTATKMAQVPFTITLEASNVKEAQRQAEADWALGADMHWEMGSCTFGPSTVQGAMKPLPSPKTRRERVYAK